MALATTAKLVYAKQAKQLGINVLCWAAMVGTQRGSGITGGDSLAISSPTTTRSTILRRNPKFVADYKARNGNVPDALAALGATR